MSDRKDYGRIGVVILAAGGSSRLGKPKQLIQFQGKSLLQHVIDQSRELGFTTNMLVLGAHAAEIKKSTDPGKFTVVINEDWKEGIGSSIRKGIRHSLEIDPKLEHILFLLSDQPMVTGEVLDKLVETHLQHGKEITGCGYRDTVGVPAIFSRRFFKELSMLEGDQGAKVLIREYPDKVATLPFELGSVDVDRPEDYDSLLNLNE